MKPDDQVIAAKDIIADHFQGVIPKGTKGVITKDYIGTIYEGLLQVKFDAKNTGKLLSPNHIITDVYPSEVSHL